MSSVSQDLPSADSFMAWGQAHTKPDLDELWKDKIQNLLNVNFVLVYENKIPKKIVYFGIHNFPIWWQTYCMFKVLKLTKISNKNAVKLFEYRFWKLYGEYNSDWCRKSSLCCCRYLLKYFLNFESKLCHLHLSNWV